MRKIRVSLAVAIWAFGAPASAATFAFVTDPFEGSAALTTPGRQVVGGEEFISFDVETDVFALDPTVFGTGSEVLFASDTAENLPASGVNVVVLRTTDNDGDPGTPFAAGTAASLIAAQITSTGPGFFIYFNSGLDLPRLVFSTDLGDETADLKILFRMTNLAGQSGALASFSGANFVFVPEPSSAMLLSTGAFLGAVLRRAGRRSRA